MVTSVGDRLHRVASGDLEDELFVGVRNGTTVCGLTEKKLHMPGVAERLGLPRCSACCKRLGIPLGTGAPFNQDIVEPQELS